MSPASNHQYDALARFLIALGKLRGGPEPADLCIHKALLTDSDSEVIPAPSGGKVATNEWLAQRISRAGPDHVLDIGCGFGTLAATISEASSARVSGINASGFAVDFGQKFWSSRRRDKSLRLYCAAIGDDLEGIPFDAVVAVESLGYADDLASTFTWLDAICTHDASLWLLDDWTSPGLNNEDPDVVAVCDHWRRRSFYSPAEVITAAAAHNFSVQHITTLTHLVPATHKAPGQFRRRALQSAAWCLGNSSAGEVTHAFLGGWYLENLYARGVCEYQLIELRRG